MRKTTIINILGISFLLFMATACGSKNFSATIIPSPSGKYRIQATINTDKMDRTKYLCLKLHLFDHQRKELFQLQTSVSHTMKWALGWMEKDDIVVLYSSDIGTTLAYAIENSTLKQIETSKSIEEWGKFLKEKKYASH